MGSCEKDDPDPEPARPRGKIAQVGSITYSGSRLSADKERSRYYFDSNTLDLYTTEGNHFKIQILDLEAGESTPERLNYTCSDAVWGDFKVGYWHKPIIYLDKMNDLLCISNINLQSESGGGLDISNFSFYR
jgi:hypothetical protein